jgi:tetratricopeptide (TPR) repeat protein
MAPRPYSQTGCLAALLCCIGCQESLSPQARQLLQNGYAASAAEKPQEVVSSMDAFLRDHARSSRADEAYYLRGLAKYHLGDRAGARADLEAALERTDKNDIRGKSALALGDLAWDRDDMPVAADMYKVVLENTDHSVPPADHAGYRLGCVLQRLGGWEDADLQFSRVIELFSGSELATRSGRRIHGRVWTIQAGAFGDNSAAEAVVKQLSGEGLQAATVPMTGQGRLTFVVQAGRYATYEQATAALPLVKKFQPDAFVTATR